MRFSKLLASLRNRLIFLVIVIFAALYAVFFYFAKTFVVSVENELGEKLIRQQVGITKERILGYFTGDQKVIEYGVISENYQPWMKDPSNKDAETVALNSISNVCQVIHCYGWFLYSHSTLEGFDWNKSFNQIVPETIELSRDQWYLSLMNWPNAFYVQASIHPFTQIPGVFLDYILRDEEKIIGIVGTYIYMDDITRYIFDFPSEGVINLLIDDGNTIHSSIKPNEIAANTALKRRLLGQSATELLAARQITAMKQLGSDEAAIAAGEDIYVTQLQLNGHNYLGAFAYIEEFNWYAVSLFSLDEVQQRIDLYPVVSIALLILVVFIFITIYILNHQLVKPVMDINDVVLSIYRGDYTKRVGNIKTDVLNRLGLGINTMADRIDKNLKEIEQKNAQLYDAIEQANRANKAKSLFLSNMSHELRTPLNAVLGFTKFALEAKDEAEIQAHLKRIDAAGNHLLQIINDLLDFNKIEMNDFTLEETPFRIRKVIHRVLSICRVKADTKGLALKFEISRVIPQTLIGDPLRLEQILINLVNNATKFTDKGEIKLKIGALITDDEQLELHVSVKDTGIGMTPEQLSRLFKPFTQADESITRKFGGTGLGLAISKQLVEAMKGEIEVHSELGVGSEFNFFIAIKYSHENHKAEPESPTYDPEKLAELTKQKRLLLAEDNEVNQTVALGILKPLNFAIDIANNGYEALQKMEQQAYDLILMDIQMPVMDGLEATKSIRQTNQEVIIIGLSAHGTKHDADEAMQHGMNAYQTKPINQHELFADIYHLLNNQQKQQRKEQVKSEA